MKGVGEPCAGEPHARFDGGELEKERATAADERGSRETERHEPGVAYGPLPRQLPTRPRPSSLILISVSAGVVTIDGPYLLLCGSECSHNSVKDVVG